MLAPVSVVIPCYRCAATIERAVRSIAAQTLRPAQVILVDDASPDGTPAVLAALQQQYGADWIRIIRLPANAGPSSARNAGWEAASGKYVAFLDSDDAWHPRKIEIQLSWMEAHPEIAVCGHGALQLASESDAPADPGSGDAQLVSERRLYASNRFVTPSVMLRRELPQRFEPGKRHMEDYLLWLEIAASGGRIARLPHVLAYTFKAPFGEAGLSAQAWKMEKGELAVFSTLHEKGLLASGWWLLLSAFSLLKFVRRVLMLAAGYSPGGNAPRPALAHAASYLVLTQAMTALLICAGLLGRRELAADIGVVQAATLATFFSFSGNARNLILTVRTTVPREAILAARLLLLLPLGIAAALLCVVVARVDPALAVLLIARRGVEWLGELYLSECELLGRHGTARRSLIVQGALLLLVVLVVAFLPQYVLWAIGVWALVPAAFIPRFIAAGLHRLGQSARSGVALLLPHYGSTAVSGISLYAFRALLVLIVGKAAAGDLFVAFAIGSFPGSLFANVLGPSVSLHEERIGRSYLPRPLWLALIGYLALGTAFLVVPFAMPGIAELAGKSRIFWTAVGWSLLGGAVMLVAQRIRLRLLAGGQGNAVFGADVLMYVCLIAAIPALYATGREGALAALYAANAVLALLFYVTATRGLLARIDPGLEGGAAGIIAFVVFLPLFFLITGKIFNPAMPLWDSGGIPANLPLPISLAACGAGLLLFGRYGRATAALWAILGLLVLMLVSTALAHGDSEPLERAKMLLMLQIVIPSFGLVLGAVADNNGAHWPRMQKAMFAVVALVVPVQLAFTWADETYTLGHSLWLFGVYQHLQFVPVILVSAFLLALPLLWNSAGAPGRAGLVLLSGLVAVYAAAALSVLAMAGIAGGGVVFAAARLVRRKDAQAVLLAAVSLGALFGYGFLERDTDGFRTKFSFLFPPGNSWAIVSTSPGAVHRRFSGDWEIRESPADGRMFRIAVPRAPAAVLRVEGELREGRLRFSLENPSPSDRGTVVGPGRFEAEIRTDPKRGDVMIDEASAPARGVIHRIGWRFPSAEPGAQPAAASPPPSESSRAAAAPLIVVRNVAERFSDWRLFGGGIFSSTKAVVFGHSAPLPREQRTSAHNFYIDFAYNFGLLALFPVLALIVHSGVAIWRNRVRILASRQLLALTAVVAFLVLVECNLKVTLRQPYPGIAIYFLWGLLLARLAELDSPTEAGRDVG